MSEIDYDILQITPAVQGWYAIIRLIDGNKKLPVICWGLVSRKRVGADQKKVQGIVYNQSNQFVPAGMLDGFVNYQFDQKQLITDCYSFFLDSAANIVEGGGSEDGTIVPTIDPDRFYASYELFSNGMTQNPDHCLDDIFKELESISAIDDILTETEIEAFIYRIQMIEIFEINIADKPIWNAIATYPLVYGSWPSGEDFMSYVDKQKKGGDL